MGGVFCTRTLMVRRSDDAYGALRQTLGRAILVGLEFLVAGLQAYVFAVLTCIYLNDAIHLHDH